MGTKKSEFLIPELINRLNDIIDVRGDRIAFASQRLFESLLIVALIASIIFVLPFYFVSFFPGSGLLDNILTFSVTLLTMVIYLIIEDLDEPFGGIFKISDESWQRILKEMDSPQRKLELENLGKPERKHASSRRTQRADERKGVGKKKSQAVNQKGVDFVHSFLI